MRDDALQGWQKHINEYGYECITSLMYWVEMCTKPPGHQATSSATIGHSALHVGID